MQNRIKLLLFVILIITTDLNAEKPSSSPGKLKEWSFVYHAAYLKTVAGNTYAIHSPGLNYTSRNNWRRPLLSSTTIFVPSVIMNDEVWFSGLGDYYESRIGLEQILALEWEGSFGDLWRWRGAPGWSINGITMPGETGYYSFQSLTSGPAILFGFDRDWEQGLTIRITGAVTYQFIDMIHSANKLQYGISGHIGIGIGFKDGAFMGKYSDES